MMLSRNPAGSRGMSLIEVLVTLVLVSVGLLGVAALQVNSMRVNKEASVRTKASMLASSMIDRIRANQPGFEKGLYDAPFNGTGTASAPEGKDLKAWQDEIDRLLPGGAANAAGRVERQTIDGIQVVTVTVQWTERTDDATFAQSGVRTELPQFQLRTEI